MAKKRDTGISLDSFLDILTCLQGVLMLIIITTGIDAAQTKVIVATPIELSSNERPIYIEARNNMLFLVPFEEAREAVVENQRRIINLRRSAKSTEEVLEAVGDADIELENYIVDFARYLAGQIALMPREGSVGYTFTDINAETSTNWYGQIVANMDNQTEILNFLVRDDSFDIFKLARLVAWREQKKVTYSLIPGNEPLIVSGR